MTAKLHPYDSIMSADQAIAFLRSDEVVALRIRGCPCVEHFELSAPRPGSYAINVISINVVEVIFDARWPSWASHNQVVTDSLFLRPEDADAVRRKFPQCCEPVAPTRSEATTSPRPLDRLVMPQQEEPMSIQPFYEKLWLYKHWPELVKAARAMVHAHMANETMVPALDDVAKKYPNLTREQLICLWMGVNAKDRGGF